MGQDRDGVEGEGSTEVFSADVEGGWQGDQQDYLDSHGEAAHKMHKRARGSRRSNTCCVTLLLHSGHAVVLYPIHASLQLVC